MLPNVELGIAGVSTYDGLTLQIGPETADCDGPAREAHYVDHFLC